MIEVKTSSNLMLILALIYEPKKIVVNENITNKIDSNIKINADTVDCDSTLNPEGQGEALSTSN